MYMRHFIFISVLFSHLLKPLVQHFETDLKSGNRQVVPIIETSLSRRSQVSSCHYLYCTLASSGVLLRQFNDVCDKVNSIKTCSLWLKIFLYFSTKTDRIFSVPKHNTRNHAIGFSARPQVTVPWGNRFR